MDINQSELTRNVYRNRLDTNRDSELVQRFVRMNLDENEEISEEEPETDSADATKLETEPVNLNRELLDSNLDESGKIETGSEPARSRKQSTVSISSQKLLAKQITQELKKKRKRRRLRCRKNEEIYTDKDRAAAMSMGSKDIKTSLKVKRRQDRSKGMSIPEEAEPGNFIALGCREKKCGNFKLAVEFYTKALELNPEEKNALVSRSQCYILMGQPKLALQDAESALTMDKNFIRAIFQKAEALYHLGEFEHSLMFYHRGLRIRPDLEGFQLGVHKAQKAIENAIGTGTITPNNSNSKMNSPKTKSTPSSSKCSKRSKSSTRLMHVPKQLCVEMKYLDGLLKHPDIKCKLTEHSDLRPQIQEAVQYLNTRQEFWKQQLPSKFK